MHKGVAIGGFMGAGKSAVGERLASRLGYRFVDTDTVLAKAHGPIAEQFARDGESVFRAREAALIKRLCEQGTRTVVATGGGVWADAESRALLKDAFATVVLDAPLDVCLSRCRADARRPLIEDAERLWKGRRGAYRDADHVVDARGDLEEVVAAVLACVDPLWAGRVEVDGAPYPVHLATTWGHLGGALRGVFPKRSHALVVSEPRVYTHWGLALREHLAAAGWRCDVVVRDVTEETKNLDVWSQFLDDVLAQDVDRGTVVFALGGGVLGDVAGFVAATALRGLPWVQLPTTVLAMADSGVGGKTGVNHGGVKNRVGAFHQPSLVYAALQTLETLPEVERVNGMAEVIKTAVVGDSGLFERLESAGLDQRSRAVLRDAICSSLGFKAQVVGEDPLESGKRALLNAGHTVGHALERAMARGTLRHGEAVAIGLVAEARWAERRGLCRETGLGDRLARVLTSWGLPTELPEIAVDSLVDAMRLDKKVRGDTLVLPVPRRVGHYEIVDVDLADLPSLVIA